MKRRGAKTHLPTAVLEKTKHHSHSTKPETSIERIDSSAHTDAETSEKSEREKADSAGLFVGGNPIMDLIVQGFTGLAAISGLTLTLMGLIGYWKNNESLAIWLFYSTIVLILTAFFLSWQARIWKAEVSVVLPNTSVSNELHGLLIPGADQRIGITCQGTAVPNEVPVVLLGKFVLIPKGKMTGVEVYGQKLVAFNPTGAGISISARVISPASKVVAQITDNEFYVNPSRYFTMHRDEDWHSLRVIDGAGNQVLYVRYMNPNTIKVLGSFYVPNGPPAVITEDKMVIGGTSFAGGCVDPSEGGTGFRFDEDKKTQTKPR